MTIICAWCKKELGEKCESCGAQDRELSETKMPDGRVFYACSVCESSWLKGQSPPTHGCCARCQNKMKEEYDNGKSNSTP